MKRTEVASPGEKTNKNGIRAVLNLDGFRQLWIGQIFSQLADKFYIVLMVYMIAQHWVSGTNSDNEVLAGVANAMRMDFDTRAQKITLFATGIYIANTIPAMIFGSLAGIAADRWPKKPLMIASNGLRALIVLLVPLSLNPGPAWLGIAWGFWALIIMTFIESLLTQFFAPAEQASIPLLVPQKYLLAANSLYQATSMAATIAGFALGEPIIRYLNRTFLGIGVDGGEYLLFPFCYGFAAISISRISLRDTTKTTANKSMWRELLDGIKIVKNRPTIRSAMFNLVVLYSLLAAMYVLSISLASSIKDLGPTGFGTLLAVSGIGMASGAIAIAQLGHSWNKKRLTTAGLATITWSLIMLGQAKGSLVFTLTLCCSIGIGAALVAIPSQTTLQEDTPKKQLGKVFGLQNNLINISLSLPLVIAGGLVSRYGLNPVLWLLAGLALIAAFLEFPWKHC